MISVFRNFTKSKWGAALFGLIMLSFVVVGAQLDVFANLGPKHVISAGERSMNEAEFRTAFDRVRENLQQQAQRPVTIQDLIAENIHTRFLDSQTQQLGFLDWAWKAGIRPGKELVLKQIRQIPAFFNQVTGQFDQQQYEQMLGQQNLTPAMLEQDLRDQYVSEHYGAAVFAGARVPRIYGALLAGQAFETRDGRWFSVTQAMAGQAPAPTEQQLTTFLQENAERLRSPEFRQASIVLFSPDAASTNAAIPEARIVERFNFKKDTLSTPETRTFTTLTAPNREAAARIAAALRAGKTPQEAGAAERIEPAQFTEQPRSAIGDPAVAGAVFGLQANQVSEPVQARVGFTVARVTAINPGAEATLENSRAAIIDELHAEDSKADIYRKVEAYERSREGGKTLADAAGEAGGRVVQLPPFTRDGKLPNGQDMNAPPQVIETAYTLAKGGESDVIDAGQGQYFAIRLNDIRPSAVPTLAEVREPLAQQWTLRENARRLAAKAEELSARVRGGEDIAAVARSAGAELTSRNGVVRDRPTSESLGQGLLQGLFGQAKGQVFSQPASESSYVVGRVDGIHAASAAIAGPLAEQVRPRITQEMVQAVIEQSMKAAAMDRNAKNDPPLARQALGLPAEGAAPAAPAQ